MMRDGALHDVLRTYLERLAGPDCGSPAEAELLADNLCNLVALLTARDAAEHRASQECVTDLDRMFAFLRRHLSDPDLSSQALADHIQASARSRESANPESGFPHSRQRAENCSPSCLERRQVTSRDCIKHHQLNSFRTCSELRNRSIGAAPNSDICSEWRVSAPRWPHRQVVFETADR